MDAGRAGGICWTCGVEVFTTCRRSVRVLLTSLKSLESGLSCWVHAGSRLYSRFANWINADADVFGAKRKMRVHCVSMATLDTGDDTTVLLCGIPPCSIREATVSEFAFDGSEFAISVIGGTVVKGLKSVSPPNDRCVMESKNDVCLDNL